MKDIPIELILGLIITAIQIPLLFGLSRIYWHFEKRARWIDWAWDNLPMIWPIPFLVLAAIFWRAFGQLPLWGWLVIIGMSPVVFAMLLGLMAYEP